MMKRVHVGLLLLVAAGFLMTSVHCSVRDLQASVSARSSSSVSGTGRARGAARACRGRRCEDDTDGFAISAATAETEEGEAQVEATSIVIDEGAYGATEIVDIGPDEAENELFAIANNREDLADPCSFLPDGENFFFAFPNPC